MLPSLGRLNVHETGAPSDSKSAKGAAPSDLSDLSERMVQAIERFVKDLPRELKIQIMNDAFPDEAVQCDEKGWLEMWERVKNRCSGSQTTHSHRLDCARNAMAEFNERCRRRVTLRLEVPGFPPSTVVYASLDELPTTIDDDDKIDFELETVPGAIFEMNVKCKLIVTHYGRRWVLTKIEVENQGPGFTSIDRDSFSIEDMWVNGEYLTEPDIVERIDNPLWSDFMEPEVYLDVANNFLFKGKVIDDNTYWNDTDNGNFTAKTSTVLVHLRGMTQRAIRELHDKY
jgi:hypothetical protein